MKEIYEDYKIKIDNWIQLLQDRIVVFDYDGTLIEMAHTPKTLLPCRNADLNKYAIDHDIYANVRPLKIMQHIINRLNPNNVYVLTVSLPNVIEQKQQSIERLYPTVLKNHVFHVANVNAKAVALQQLHAERCSNLVFIDDALETLLLVEESLSYVKAVHISSFMP